MSYERLAHALLQGRQYYGPALRSLQGLPERHRCMQPVVEAAAAMAGDRPLDVLEIGSWAGGSAVSWASAVKALPRAGRVLCVDAWKPYFDVEVDREPIYAEMNAAVEHGDVFRLFLHNLQSADVADLVDYKVGATRDILPQLEPASFDIIYVDGSHAVDDVTFDVAQAMRLIRDGGIVCGDDLELPREAVDAEEHRDAVASRCDYAWSQSARAHYHPGVTEAVARLIGHVFSWNGYWAARRTRSVWQRFEFQPGPMPAHIADALRQATAEKDGGPRDAPELIDATPGYNLVRIGARYIAVAKRLGPIALTDEKFGERELPPHLLLSRSLEELRTRVAVYDDHSEPPQLVGETSTHNLMRCGSRFVGVAKALGHVSLGEDRLGDRDLPPNILVDDSLDALRARLVEAT